MTLMSNVEEKKFFFAFSSTLDLSVISTTLCHNFISNTRIKNQIYIYTYRYTSIAFQSAVSQIYITYVPKANVAPILASKKTSSDHMAYMNIIPTFSWQVSFHLVAHLPGLVCWGRTTAIYRIIILFHIAILSHHIKVKLLQSNLAAPPMSQFYHIANEAPVWNRFK